MNNLQAASLLKYLRNNYNFTIQKVASLLGVSKAAVSKWENGDDITTEHLYDLAKLYNVSFSELYYGKLNNEDNNDYWRRNYDLSNYELEDDINNKNVENLKNLFEHCNMVKSRFYKLLPRWAKDELNNNELDEFKFIKKYFKFDVNYYAYIKYGPRHIAYADENTEKEFTKEILKATTNLDKKSFAWELNKLFDFIYDYKSDDICKSGNLKALEYMLSTFSQIEKDSILYANLHVEEEKEVESFFGSKTKQKQERDRTIEEIEYIPYFKIIINSGANCLYQYKSHSNGWDEEKFKCIEGKIIEVNEEVYNKYSFSNFEGQKFIPMISNWKIYSYKDYLAFINHDETNRLRDIVNIKDSDPLKYYENMIERGYDHVQ